MPEAADPSGPTPDPIDAGDLPTRLRLQAGHCRRLGSELYADLLLRAADDAEAGGPVAAVLAGHEGDPAESMPALRLMGAVHRRVLEGALPELAPSYPSMSGVPFAPTGNKGDTAEVWQQFRRALEVDGSAIRDLLDRPVQTNEVGRCAALLPAFLAVAAETRLPLRLLEVGTSAGLNLRWDHYRYEADGFEWGDPGAAVRLRFELAGEELAGREVEVEVAERRGCDRAPIDPTSEDGRLTLLSYLWPDQLNRLQRVRAALNLAAEVPVEVDQAAAAEWVAAQLARRTEGLATVVFHSIVMLYLPEQERREFERTIEEAGRRADAAAPLAWLRMEADGERAAVRLRTWPGGEDRLFARASYHGDLLELS
jgi:hypothetical protein